MSKYLYEKDYKKVIGNRPVVDRKIFNSSKELLEYMLEQGECNFNAGCEDAEIRLYRISEV